MDSANRISRRTRRSRSARSSSLPCRDILQMISRAFSFLSLGICQKAQKEIDVKTNPSYLTAKGNLVPADGASQEVQKAANACCHEQLRCRFQTKKEVVDIQQPTVLKENEMVADAYEHCSHQAPPCCAEPCPEVTHGVVIEFVPVLEQWKPPFVFADAKVFCVLCSRLWSDRLLRTSVSPLWLKRSPPRTG